MDDRTRLDDYIRAERLRIIARYPFVSMLADGKLCTDPLHPACPTADAYQAFIVDSWDAHQCTAAEAADLAAIISALPKNDLAFVYMLSDQES